MRKVPRSFPFPLYASILGLWLCSIILFRFVPAHIIPITRPWYDGCISLYYGQGEVGEAEHGNDLSCFPYGTPITALLGGVVSFAGNTNFGFYEVTLKIDRPFLARGSPYAYVEDMSAIVVHRGQHIAQGTRIGYSKTWVEFGLSPDSSYAITGWHWGINSLFLIQEARAGTIPPDHVPPSPVKHIVPKPTPKSTLPKTVCIQYTVLSVSEARTCAYIAGFRGKQINIIVAIAQAESSLRTNAIGPQGEVGILQFYLIYHPNVSRSCALNSLCSFQAAYNLSAHGTNFTPWTTYDTGAYLRYL